MNTITAAPVTKRLRYLDAAKGWGFCMVVFGHITALGNPVDTWFSSYKLAIFFVVSGYLLCMRQTLMKYTITDYWKKQIKTLLIPYFGYSVLTIAYHIFVGLMKGKSCSSIFHKFLEQAYATCSLRGISALWFLPSLLIGQMLFIVVIKAPKWVKVISSVIPLLILGYAENLLPKLAQHLSGRSYKLVSFPILTVSKGFLAFWFIGAGYLAYKVLEHISERNLRFLIGVVLFVGNICLSQQNAKVDLNLMRLGDHPSLMYIGGIAGSLGTILILEFLERWWSMTFLNFCGKYSLIIMATHGTLGLKNLMIAGWKTVVTLSDTPGIRYYFECTCILLNLFLMECGVITIIEKYFPWLMGRFQKKEKK